MTAVYQIITLILQSFPQLPYKARRFFTSNKLLVFLPFLPLGWEVFYLVTNSYISTRLTELTPRGKEIVIPRSRDLQSRDPPMRLFLFVSIQPLKL